MEPNYQIEGNVIVDFMKYVSAWSMNTASRTSFGKETASKYDYCYGNAILHIKRHLILMTINTDLKKTNI